MSTDDHEVINDSAPASLSLDDFFDWVREHGEVLIKEIEDLGSVEGHWVDKIFDEAAPIQGGAVLYRDESADMERLAAPQDAFEGMVPSNPRVISIGGVYRLPTTPLEKAIAEKYAEFVR